VLIGGGIDEKVAQFGKNIGKVPSRRIKQVVDVLVAAYRKERQEGESLEAWTRRVDKAHAAELIAAFNSEPDERLRRILLGILCEARLPEALPVFVEHLRSEDDCLRYWSEQGLRSLNTHESRKVLGEVARGKRGC